MRVGSESLPFPLPRVPAPADASKIPTADELEAIQPGAGKVIRDMLAPVQAAHAAIADVSASRYGGSRWREATEADARLAAQGHEPEHLAALIQGEAARSG